jgi:DNA polymerase (family 10)
MTKSSSERRSFGKRRLSLDVIGWAAAIALVAFTYGIDTTDALLLAGVAVVFQVGLGLAQGVYTGRSSLPVLGEIGVAIGTVILTTFLIIVAKFATNAQFVPTGAILVGGVVALALTGGARFVWYVATERLKRGRGVKKRAVKRPVRFPLDQSLALAEHILAQLSLKDAVLRCSCAGSLRRMQSTVGDIDLIVASDRPKEVVDAFFSLATGQHILKVPKREWQTHAVALTHDGLQVELWVVPPALYGAALIFKSGSRAHNLAMYKWVLKYGHSSSRTRERVKHRWTYLYTTVFLPLLHRTPAEEGEIDLLRRILPRRNGVQTEEDVYEGLGLQWIPPTLREGEGELEMASQRCIPEVVELTDIRGDLLIRSAFSGGRASNHELVSAAVERGYEYITITDRFRDRGDFDLALVECQRMEIQALNAWWRGKIAVFYGAELSIGLEGELDYPDAMIEHFDLVIASIQSDTHQHWDRLTRRLVRVMQHPKVHIIALPTGRIGERERCIFDADEVCRAASRQRVALEINADPQRLDLPSEYVRRARANDVLFAISTKARCVADLAYMRFGVTTAQRCYAAADVIINAWPLERLRRFLTKGHMPNALPDPEFRSPVASGMDKQGQSYTCSNKG